MRLSLKLSISDCKVSFIFRFCFCKFLIVGKSWHTLPGLININSFQLVAHLRDKLILSYRVIDTEK